MVAERKHNLGQVNGGYRALGTIFELSLYNKYCALLIHKLIEVFLNSWNSLLLLFGSLLQQLFDVVILLMLSQRGQSKKTKGFSFFVSARVNGLATRVLDVCEVEKKWGCYSFFFQMDLSWWLAHFVFLKDLIVCSCRTTTSAESTDMVDERGWMATWKFC